jgi:hypothetical protein
VRNEESRRGMRRLRLIPASAAEVISPKCSLVRLASSIPLRLAQSLSRGGGRARRRAELDDEPLPLGSQPCGHLAGAAGGQAVPDQRRLLAGEIAHLGERDDQALGFVARRCSRTAGADRDAAVPAGRLLAAQSRRRRRLPPVPSPLPLGQVPLSLRCEVTDSMLAGSSVAIGLSLALQLLVRRVTQPRPTPDA